MYKLFYKFRLFIDGIFEFVNPIFMLWYMWTLNTKMQKGIFTEVTNNALLIDKLYFLAFC